MIFEIELNGETVEKLKEWHYSEEEIKKLILKGWGDKYLSARASSPEGSRCCPECGGRLINEDIAWPDSYNWHCMNCNFHSQKKDPGRYLP